MGRQGVRAIIGHEGKFLLVRNRSSRGNFWCLPGGGIEPGEDIVSAMRRELIEETGVEPDIGNVLYLHQLGDPGAYGGPDYFFHIRNGADYTHIDLSRTTHGEKELLAVAFKDVRDPDLWLLPAFLKQELPELAAQNFEVPARIRIEAFE